MWLVKLLCTKLGNQERLVCPDQDSISSFNKCSVPTLHFSLPFPRQDCQEEKKKQHLEKNKLILCRDLKCWNTPIAVLECNDIGIDIRLHPIYSQVLCNPAGRIKPKEKLLWAVKTILQHHVFCIIFPIQTSISSVWAHVSWETESNARCNKILKF